MRISVLSILVLFIAGCSGINNNGLTIHEERPLIDTLYPFVFKNEKLEKYIDQQLKREITDSVTLALDSQDVFYRVVGYFSDGDLIFSKYFDKTGKVSTNYYQPDSLKKRYSSDPGICYLLEKDITRECVTKEIRFWRGSLLQAYFEQFEPTLRNKLAVEALSRPDYSWQFNHQHKMDKATKFIVNAEITGVESGIAMCRGKFFMYKARVGQDAIIFPSESILFEGGHAQSHRVGEFTELTIYTWDSIEYYRGPDGLLRLEYCYSKKQ